MKVIGLVGMPGSGKDVVVEQLSKNHPALRMGDVVIDETKRRGLEVSDENVGAVAKRLRDDNGLDAIAKLSLPRLSELKTDMTIINGIRGLAEVEFFKRSFEDFILLGVHASPRTRYQRVNKRQREDDIASWDEFVERDRRELRWGLGDALALSDILIVNEGTLENLKRDVERIEKELE